MPLSPSVFSPRSAPAGNAVRLRSFDEPEPSPVEPTAMSVIISIIIVMDDGTDLGDVVPGGSTAPIALTTPMASFHCTLHPSMVGGINMDPPAPVPDPYYPPSDDYDGYY
jgi:hypothetical protein